MSADTIPQPLREAARQLAVSSNAEESFLALIRAFGHSPVGSLSQRRAAWLCILATNRIIPGWRAMDCEGDAPARAVETAAAWIRDGADPGQWESLCRPAVATRGGEKIDDCDACRAEPIASAAALTARFARFGEPADAAHALSEAWMAEDEGIRRPGSLPIEKWILQVALPAAWALRPLTDTELES